MTNRYEGFFILNVAGKEDAFKTELDRIQDEIKSAGGKVESVQKMDFKPFARPKRKLAGGFYANIVFASTPDALTKLRGRFSMDEAIYRVQITHAAPVPKPAEDDEKKETKEKRGKS